MIKEYFDAQILDFLRIVEPRRKHDSYKTGFSLVVRDCYGTRPTGPILGKSRPTEIQSPSATGWAGTRPTGPNPAPLNPNFSK